VPSYTLEAQAPQLFWKCKNDARCAVAVGVMLSRRGTPCGHPFDGPVQMQYTAMQATSGNGRIKIAGNRFSSNTAMILARDGRSRRISQPLCR
jgi:hypothetical protein